MLFLFLGEVAPSYRKKGLATMCDSAEEANADSAAAIPQGESEAPTDAAPILGIPPIRMPPEVPHRLELGGSEAFELYRKVFDSIYRRRLTPLVDPQRRVICFDEDACEHVCYHEDRFLASQRRVEGAERIRDRWEQVRAEHILFILPALTDPSYIVPNNQVKGNLAYLLGFPTNDLNHPLIRYYVSVRPMNEKATRVKFKTAYPIAQWQWGQALQGNRGAKHILYRRKISRF